MRSEHSCPPLLRWPGGKSRLLPEIKQRMPSHYRGYHEPFCGVGAMVFDLQPAGGFMSDMNAELINFYKVVKNHPKALAAAFSKY